MNFSRVSLLKIPTLLSCLLFIGCASYRYESVENKYQKSGLPLHFDRVPDEDKRAVSGGVKRYSAKKIEYEKPFTINVDSTGRSYDDPPSDWNFDPITSSGYRLIESAPYLVDFAYLQEIEWFHFGFSTGLSVSDIHHYGVFGGVSRKFGDVIPAFSVGLYRNWVGARLSYWSKSNSHTDLYGTWVPGSDEGMIPRWDVATRAGALYDRGFSISPYASYSNNRVALAGSLHITVHEVLVGAMRPLPQRYSLFTDISYTSSRVEGFRQDNFVIT